MKKKTVLFIIGLMMGCTVFGAENKLALIVEPSPLPFTSESALFRVVFTNAGDAALTIPTPALGINLSVRVTNEEGKWLASSPTAGDEARIKKALENILSLEPQAVWETEPIDLFKRISRHIEPGQPVCVAVTYTLEEKRYEAKTVLKIPPHDTEIKPEYISKEKALAVAEQRIAKDIEEHGPWDEIKGIKPEVKCINGVYRVIYPWVPPKPMEGPEYLIRIDVDARTGKVLRVLGG